MSTRFTVSDSDFNKSEIATDGGDLTATLAPSAGEFVVEVGDNLWVAGSSEFRRLIERALQQMIDVLREAQWPDGTLATDFATLAAVPAVKGDVVVGNAAVAPAITEDGFRISYNIPLSGAPSADSGGSNESGMGGFGSSTNRNVWARKVQDFIRETLAAPAVSP